MLQMPKRLRQRPKYKGLPIPFTAFVGPDGTPDFKVVDHNNHLRCMQQRLCGLCGQELGEIIVFIGGPGAVEQQAFIDAPGHEECMLYATQACPFLANASANYHTENIKHKAQDVQHVKFEHAQEEDARPAQMAMYYARGYTIVRQGNDLIFVAYPPVKVDWDKMPKRE